MNRIGGHSSFLLRLTPQASAGEHPASALALIFCGEKQNRTLLVDNARLYFQTEMTTP